MRPAVSFADKADLADVGLIDRPDPRLSYSQQCPHIPHISLNVVSADLLISYRSTWIHVPSVATLRDGGDQPLERRLAAILAADLVGYSRLMEADEQGTHQRFADLRRHTLVPLISKHGGRVVKLLGDGLLVEFTSAVNALTCAMAWQNTVAKNEQESPKDRRLIFRIGISLGDVIAEEDDIYGEGVNLAARLEGQAKPGGICISAEIHRQARGKVSVAFEDLGERRLKNISEPVHLYHVLGSAASDTDASLPLPAKPSIAVIPFDNMSADPEQEYFSDGVTEDIITELSKISGLFVIARHSTFVYKGKSVTLKQVGRDLGVRYVLEGSVRKSRDRLRISAQLIDATTEHHLWAERYDRDLQDIFAVQDEVARSVATALAVTLRSEEHDRLGRPLTSSIEAYDIYLRTRAALWPPTRENLLTGRRAYLRITEIDPGFAGGPAGQSLTYAFAVIFGHSEEREEDARRALDLAKAAVALDEGFAQGHAALGLGHSVTGNHDEAVESTQHAVELQPGDADAYLFLAFSNLFAGRAEAAREAISAALRLDPQYVNGPYLNVLGVVCFCAGRYEEAIEAFERNLERGGPIAPPALAFRAASYYAAGYAEKARSSAQDLLSFLPTFSATSFPMFEMFKRPVDRERVIDCLRKAGLPE